MGLCYCLCALFEIRIGQTFTLHDVFKNAHVDGNILKAFCRGFVVDVGESFIQKVKGVLELLLYFLLFAVEVVKGAENTVVLYRSNRLREIVVRELFKFS